MASTHGARADRSKAWPQYTPQPPMGQGRLRLEPADPFPAAHLALGDLARLAGQHLDPAQDALWQLPAAQLPAPPAAPAGPMLSGAPLARQLFCQARQALATALACAPAPRTLTDLEPWLHAGLARELAQVDTRHLGLAPARVRERASEIMAHQARSPGSFTPIHCDTHLAMARWLADHTPAGRPPRVHGGFAKALPSHSGTSSPGMEERLRQWWQVFKSLGKNPNLKGPPGTWTPLLHCLRREVWELAADLVVDGADIHARTTQGSILWPLFKIPHGPQPAPAQQRLWFALFDAGLDWQQKDPFPGYASFAAAVPEDSYLVTIHARWRAARMDQALPPAPRDSARARM